MQPDYLIFDLDGTISNPKDGIARSINYALMQHDFDAQSEDEIARLIGLPLDQMYVHLIQQTKPSLISSLVAKYRERYLEIGYTENLLYDDIKESLIELHESKEFCLGICTSKRADNAENILEMFGIRVLFEFVSGGDIGIEKSQQLQELLERNAINRNSLMIGDRYIDLRAAHSNNLHSAGVLWGYGTRSELENETPEYIFDRPVQLTELISEQRTN